MADYDPFRVFAPLGFTPMYPRTQPLRMQQPMGWHGLDTPSRYQQPLQLPDEPQGPLPGAHQELLSRLQRFMPDLAGLAPGLVNPEAAGTPQQTLGIGRQGSMERRGNPDFQFLWRHNIPF